MTANYALHVDIPAEYHELPLHHIDTTLAACQSTLADVWPSSRTELAHTVKVLDVLLEALADHHARYCGIARHHTRDGRASTSWLTVSLLAPGEPTNPRLAVLECARHRLTDKSTTRVQPLTLAGRPVLITERRQLPTPRAAVTQLEALIPAADASRLAVIEISTNSTEVTESLREILCATAASIRFAAPVPSASRLAL